MAARKSTLEYAAEQTSLYADERAEQQADHKVEHPTPDLSTKDSLRYPGADQKDDWATNETQENLMVKFDGQTRAALKYGHNLGDYDPEDRKAIVGNCADAFNSIEWTSANERYEAARDITHTMFKPLYQEIDLRDLQGNPNFSPEVLKTLEDEGVKQVSYQTTAQGADDHRTVHEIYLKVDDMAAAQRIIDRTGGIAEVVSREKLEGSEKEFASALYDSSPDNPDSYEKLSRILDQAIEYSKPGTLHGQAMDEWLLQAGDDAQAEGRWSTFTNSLKEKLQERGEAKSAEFRLAPSPEDGAVDDSATVSVIAAEAAVVEGQTQFKNPDDFPSFDQKAHVTDFNLRNFATDQERLEAARESAQAHFQDFRDHTAQVHDMTADERQNTGRGEYAAFVPSNERYDEHLKQFTQALAHSDQDRREAAGILAEINREALAYSKGQPSWADDIRHLSFQEAQTFFNQHHASRGLMESKVEANWETPMMAVKDANAAAEWSSNTSPESEPAATWGIHGIGLSDPVRSREAATLIHAERALREAFIANLDNAVTANDEDRFNSIADSIDSHRFAYALRERPGFITQDDYQAPSLNNSFRNPAEAHAYYRSIANTLEELDGVIDPFHQEAVQSLSDDSRQYLDHWTRDSDNEFAHESLHVRARAADFFLQPKQEDGAPEHQQDDAPQHQEE